MEHELLWRVALEVIASVPISYRYQPRESAVVSCFQLEPGELILGARARLDLEDVACGGPGLLQALRGLSRCWGGSAVVSLHTDTLDDEELWSVMCRLTDIWPFADHGGYFVVRHHCIEGWTRDGESLGTRTDLELLTTQMAMSTPALNYVDGPEGFRFARSPHGTRSRRVAEAYTDWATRGNPDWQELTHRCVRALRKGGPVRAEVVGSLLWALQDPLFRDGLLGWVAAGTPAVSDLRTVDFEHIFAGTEPPHRTITDAIALLARVAAPAPAGMAALALGTAAFLAWYGGVGTQARVLAEQSIEEGGGSRLAELVLNAIQAGAPPPWFRPAVA